VLSTLTAVGRVAAEAVIAPLSLPPFPASAMDGYALRSKDLTGPPPYAMTVTGRSFAGHPFTGEVPSRKAVRIYTGAPVPKGLDAVVIQEDCDAEDSGVIIRKTVAPGDNIRPIGLDVRAGQTLFSPGTQISAFHAGWMSACGIIDIKAFKRPRVAIFSTGDELVEPGSTLGQGQIYDANRHLLHLMLSRLPVLVEDFGILPDDPDRIRTALEKAAGTCDAIVTSGGVSVGDADWVKHIVENMGNLQFWKLNLKPGKPMAYGRLGETLFFGLPGNPVSTVVTALLLAKPALLKLCGGLYQRPLSFPARLRTAITHRRGREEFQRGFVDEQNGELVVSSTGDQSSNRLATFAEANCLIRISKHSDDLGEGSTVFVLPFAGLL
jgi:molybdopterin molybdotransferase